MRFSLDGSWNIGSIGFVGPPLRGPSSSRVIAEPPLSPPVSVGPTPTASAQPLGPPAPLDVAPMPAPLVDTHSNGHTSEPAPKPVVSLEALLMRFRLITSAQLEEAMREKAETGKDVGAIVVARGWVNEDQLSRLLSYAPAFPAETQPEPAHAPEPQNSFSPAFEATVAAETEPAAEVPDEPVAELQPEPAAAPQPEPVAETQPEPFAQAQPEPIGETQPEPFTQAQAEPIAEAQSVFELAPALIQTLPPALELVEAQPQHAHESGTTTEPEPEAVTTAETTAEPEPQPAFEPQPEPVFEAQPESAFATQPEPAFEPYPEPAFQAQGEPAFQTSSEPATEPKPEPEPTLETQAEPAIAEEPAPTPVADLEPTAVAEPEPAPAAAAEAQVVRFVDPRPIETIARVFVRISNGERIEAGTYDDIAAAKTRAEEVVREVSGTENGWPFYGGRYIRPEAIVSVDVDATVVRYS